VPDEKEEEQQQHQQQQQEQYNSTEDWRHTAREQGETSTY